jgi:hypothetical protein
MPRITIRRTATLALLVLALVVGTAGTALALGHYEGTYMGRDGHDNRIHLSYHGTTVQNFEIGHKIYLHQGHVSHGEFHTSQNGVEFFGLWETSHHVTGWYRYHRNHKMITVHWSVNAYSH